MVVQHAAEALAALDLTSVTALVEIGFAGDTTVEVAGPENVKASLSRLAAWLGSARPLGA